MAYRDYDNYINAYDYIINQLFIYDYSDEDDFNILKMKIWALDGIISVADSGTVVEDDIDDPKIHFEALLNELTFLDSYIKTVDGTLGEYELNFTQLKARRNSVMTAWIAEGNNDYDMRYSTRPTLLTDAQFALLYTAFVTKRTAGELSVAEDIVKSVTNYCIDNEIFQAERTVLNYIVPSAAEENLTQLASAGIDDHDRNYVNQMNDDHDEIVTIVGSIAPTASGQLVLVNFPQRREQVSTIFEHSSHRGLISLDEGYLFTYMTSAGEETSISPIDDNNISPDYTGNTEWTHDDFVYGNYWYDSEVTGWWILDYTNDFVDIDSLPLGELLTDGGIESWTGDVPDEWDINVSGTGSAIEDETVIVHGGSHSCKCTMGPSAFGGELVVNGGDWDISIGSYNDVVTVGPAGYDYTSPSQACTAAPDGALILIYPGTYTNEYLHNQGGKTLHIRGMPQIDPDDPSEVHIIIATGQAGFALYGADPDVYEMIIENLTMTLTDAGAGLGSLLHYNTSSYSAVLRINKCYMSSSYNSAGIALGTGYGFQPYKGSFYITYSYYAPVNFYHMVYNHAGSSTWVEVSTTELNKPWTIFGSDPPDLEDIVTSPTSGYGYEYGDYLTDITEGILGWTPSGSALLDRVVGGLVGLCLEITEDGEANPGAVQVVSGITPGESYSFEAYVKAGTENSWLIAVINTDDESQIFTQNGSAPADWTTHVTEEFIAPAGCTAVRIELYSLAGLGTGDTLFYDSVSLKQISNNVLIQQLLTFVDGLGYVIELWLYGDGSGGIRILDVTAANGGLDETVIPPATWTKYTFGFTANGYSDRILIIRADPTETSWSYYVDDVSVISALNESPGSLTRARFNKLSDRWDNLNRIREDKVVNIGTRVVLESMIDAVIDTIETDNEDHLVDKIAQKQYYTETLVDNHAEYV